MYVQQLSRIYYCLSYSVDIYRLTVFHIIRINLYVYYFYCLSFVSIDAFCCVFVFFFLLYYLFNVGIFMYSSTLSYIHTFSLWSNVYVSTFTLSLISIRFAHTIVVAIWDDANCFYIVALFEMGTVYVSEWICWIFVFLRIDVVVVPNESAERKFCFSNELAICLLFNSENYFSILFQSIAFLNGVVHQKAEIDFFSIQMMKCVETEKN